MSRTRTVRLGAFNIVTHPHATEHYRQLLLEARKLKRLVPIWGDTHGLLATAYSNDGYVTGEIYTFLDLKPDLDWFDITAGEQATEEQTAEVQIPANLRPHLKKLRYIFFPKDHLFVYVRSDSAFGGISPSRMEEFLTILLNDNRLLEKFPFQEVDIRLQQEKESVDEIFSRIQVDRLEILIKRPNGDSTSGQEEKSVEQELSEQNIAEYFVAEKAERGKQIVPNEKTRAYMEVATGNGHVQASGYDANEVPRTLNTKESPLIETFKYDTRVPYLDFILESAKKLTNKLFRRQ